MKNTVSIETIKREIAASYKQNNAWSRGVYKYVEDLLNEIGDHSGNGTFNMANVNKNGFIGNVLRNPLQFEAWKIYSRGGCSLVYDRDIAERLCTPSELKKTEYGMKQPNRNEDWLDLQGRALFQAADLIRRAVVELA